MFSDLWARWSRYWRKRQAARHRSGWDVHGTHLLTKIVEDHREGKPWHI